MTKFYTNISRYGNTMLVRESIDGISSNRRDFYKPTYYLRDNNSTSGLTSLYGDTVSPVQPGTMGDARDWCKKYSGTSGIEVYGQQNEILQYANEYDFHGWDFEKLKVYSIDIEVAAAADGSFPDPKFALGMIQLITVQDIHTERCFTWGVKGYTPTGKHSVKTAYTECTDEKNLMKLFLAFWGQGFPDIVTGWNVGGFDMPYLVNRIQMILGDEFAKKLSPWNLVSFKIKSVRGQDEADYSITGIAVLDMLLLYKKFTFGNHASYSLGAIAQEELGTTKLENPTESFGAFFRDEYDLYTEYNIVDTQLVTKLNGKLRLLQLACTIAYEAKVNYEDVFSPVKTWDAIIHNALLENNVVSPPRKHTGSALNGIEGAYVKTPVPGMYKNVVSFDFLSMYPSIMIALNLSPETYLGQCDSNVDKCLSGDIENKDKNICMGANGSLYRKDIGGIIPTVIKTYMKKRRDAKNAMLDIERAMEDIKCRLAVFD